MKTVYLSGPVGAAAEYYTPVYNQLIAQGFAVYCPVYTRQGVEKTGVVNTPHDAAAWLSRNIPFMKQCTDFHAFKLPGWRTCPTLNEELKYAVGAKIPVMFIEYDE